MHKTDKIYIAGHRGMVGSSLVRKLRAEGFENLLMRTSAELDLRRQDPVQEFFEEEKHISSASQPVFRLLHIIA